MATWLHAVSHSEPLDQTMLFQAATKVWRCDCTRRRSPHGPANADMAECCLAFQIGPRTPRTDWSDHDFSGRDRGLGVRLYTPTPSWSLRECAPARKTKKRPQWLGI